MTVVTVTLNPMVDKTIDVPCLRPGETTRGTRLGVSAGGKGINVARALLRFGLSVRAVTFVGAETGAHLERLCVAEGIPLVPIRTASATRVGNTFRTSDGLVTSLFEPPPVITVEEAAQLAKEAKALLREHCLWLACCGSSPSSTTDDIVPGLLEEARRLGLFTALDSYGAILERGIGAEPSLVRINRHEAEQLFGRPLQSDHDLRRALDDLINRGVGAAVITDGSRPFLARDEAGTWKVTPAAIPTVNPVGSGDCMLAGMILGNSNGWDFPESLRFATGAAVVNAGMWDVARCSPDLVRKTLETISIQKLS